MLRSSTLFTYDMRQTINADTARDDTEPAARLERGRNLVPERLELHGSAVDLMYSRNVDLRTTCSVRDLIGTCRRWPESATGSRPAFGFREDDPRESACGPFKNVRYSVHCCTVDGAIADDKNIRRRIFLYLYLIYITSPRVRY